MMTIRLTNLTKITIASVLQMAFCLTLNAQCSIEAGADRNVCMEEILDGPILMGEVIDGDIEQFSWHSEYYSMALNQSYYASSMLNDTSLLQPTIEYRFERTVTYYLTGTTSGNESCTDSVTLNFSEWQFLLLDKVIGKQPEDTVQLWVAAYSNWPHVQYEWSPNFMILDTTVEKPLVWNNVTTFYNLKITDSIGCSVTDDVFEVYVNTSSTKEAKNLELNVYPNPFTESIKIDSKQPIQYVELLDLNGRLISKNFKTELNLIRLNSGSYILRILMKDNSQLTKLIQKVDP